MLLVLAPKITNRLRYIFNLLLNDLLGLETCFTASLDEFSTYEGAKFSYGVSLESDALFFAANHLLFETGISSCEVSCFDYAGSKAFFAVYQKSSAMPFDVFAASFFLVSRYEEYLPQMRDEHGRFRAMQSEAYRNGFLRKPLVNSWALELKKVLQDRFPELEFSLPSFKFIPTIDVDAAFAYKHKGMTRAVGGFFKAINRSDYQELRERIEVLLGRRADPFDTYEVIMALQKKYSLKTLFFILLADYGVNDKNLPVQNRYFRQIIRELADYADVGIHPSYASSGNAAVLQKEISRLSGILHRDILKSRQHFLRLEMPTTYRNLINCDIAEDYTMGYAEEAGFRASICSPYNFFDLDLDRKTPLRIFPFALMDGTLNDYMDLTPVQASDLISNLMKEVKAVGGTFISLWHNSTLNDQRHWKGWLMVYEDMIRLAVKGK
ncbi:MAG TPA: polysaccharide deacetylase family protein [Bacteroidales bacterium]|nr:polysaccharide deacetylase family protein [Bacteroidales bacterium]